MHADARRIPIGRVRGHRGTNGEITVVVASGDGGFWVDLARVFLHGAASASRPYQVETARSYRDRLVLKLRGVDDPSVAAGLRGCSLAASAGDACAAAHGRFHPALFVGLDAVDDSGRALGRVTGVWPTRGTDLLVLETRAPGGGPGREILLPAAAEFLGAVDEPAGTVVVRPPPGLLDLGHGEAEPP